VIPDILQVSGALFASLGPTPFAEIERQIKRAKTSPDGIEQNLIVARALEHTARADEVTAVHRSFYSMTVGMLDQIRLWPDFFVIMDGKAWIPFFDTRRSNRLTAIARKFTFSLQHEHIRALDPDMSDAGLCVVQFVGTGSTRSTKIYRHADEELFGYDELERMIDETYRMWTEISHERTEEVRRRAGGSGPLF
jgi:hypothetical protein